MSATGVEVVEKCETRCQASEPREVQPLPQLPVIRLSSDTDQPSLKLDEARLLELTAGEPPTILCDCKCQIPPEKVVDEGKMQEMLEAREAELREEFKKCLQLEREYLRDRFNFILQNEQIRASLMLREAHRERKEKISALQNQLECKNLSALMYVMCAERRKGKLEKLQVVEKYTEYIENLNKVLTDSQELILNLSRGYKTAARVHHEWQEKMKKVVEEFQNFIYSFTGGTPETSQFYFDLPALLKCETPLEDNPSEDPIQKTPEEEAEDERRQQEVEEEAREKEWWEKLDAGSKRPFVLYGDMGHFKAPVRRGVLDNIKAAKSAPRKWKEYAFHDMFMQSDCPKADELKNDYLSRLMEDPVVFDCNGIDMPPGCASTHRFTATSIDTRGNMGSILKIMTNTGSRSVPNRAAILGARDSLEIGSTTKLKENWKQKRVSKNDPENDIINVGERKASFYEIDSSEETCEPTKADMVKIKSDDAPKIEEDVSLSIVKKLPHTDSLEVKPLHTPDNEAKINLERVCPSEQCKLQKTDSFMRSLPPYMTSNPFTVYSQSFDNYEACTPEQIKLLRQRLHEKKMPKVQEEINPLDDWDSTSLAGGVYVQTSGEELVMERVLPCTCKDSIVSPNLSGEIVYKVEDLVPMKIEMDEIKEGHLHNNFVEFNRFKVIGEEKAESQNAQAKDDEKLNFTTRRVRDIREILKAHPSLCEIFQANARC